MTQKQCYRCSVLKPLTGYYESNPVTCIDCLKAYQKKYREANRVKRCEAQKELYLKNREKILDYQKAYREAHREEKNQYQREYNKTAEANSKAKKWREQYKNNLSDAYIRRELSHNSTLTSKDIPQSLVEVKRLQLQIKRMAENEKC
jgi:hypothetical protein